MWLTDRYAKIIIERTMLIFYIRQRCTMANFTGPGILHFGKIGYRLTQHSPTLRRKSHSFYGYLLLISPLPAPDRIT